METTKYKLVDASPEEQKDFMGKFQALLKETEMYYEPVPQFTRDSVEDPWKVVCQVLLQKKVLLNEPIISPIQPEDVTPPTTS